MASGSFGRYKPHVSVAGFTPARCRQPAAANQRHATTFNDDVCSLDFHIGLSPFVPGYCRLLRAIPCVNICAPILVPQICSSGRENKRTVPLSPLRVLVYFSVNSE